MTRRDYLLISDAINRALNARADETTAERLGAELVIRALCDALAEANHQFDRHMFLANCGVE